MKNEVNYWLATIPISVAALVWILNQLSTLVNLRLADRRVLRETIYFLLELRHLLRVALKLRNPNKFSTLFFTSLEQRVPGLTFSDAERAPFDAMIAQILPKMEAQMVAMSGLRDGYAAAILKLSSVDPLNAYRLRGKDSLLSFVNDLNEQATDVLTQQASTLNDPGRQQRMQRTAQLIQPKSNALLINAGIKEVEEILRDIARKVGWNEQRQLKRLLVEDEAASDAAVQQALEEGVNGLVEVIEQQFLEDHPEHEGK